MKFKLVEAAESKICCICKKPFDGYGNNAEPVCSGSCCDECNIEKVIPMRFKMMEDESKELNEEFVEVEGDPSVSILEPRTYLPMDNGGKAQVIIYLQTDADYDEEGRFDEDAEWDIKVDVEDDNEHYVFSVLPENGLAQEVFRRTWFPSGTWSDQLDLLSACEDIRDYFYNIDEDDFYRTFVEDLECDPKDVEKLWNPPAHSNESFNESIDDLSLIKNKWCQDSDDFGYIEDESIFNIISKYFDVDDIECWYWKNDYSNNRPAYLVVETVSDGINYFEEHSGHLHEIELGDGTSLNEDINKIAIIDVSGSLRARKNELVDAAKKAGAANIKFTNDPFDIYRAADTTNRDVEILIYSNSDIDKDDFKKHLNVKFIDVNESLNEGNPVSGKIPESIDSFLQDIAQMYETIDYGDIMDHDYTEDDIRKLNNLRRRFITWSQYDEDDEEVKAKFNEIANKVAEILKRVDENINTSDEEDDSKMNEDMSIRAKLKALYPELDFGDEVVESIDEAAGSKVTLEVMFEEYKRYEQGDIRRAKVSGKDLLSALKKMVDNMGLYIDSEEIEEENLSAEEVIKRIESSNGDGCDFVFYIKNLTTGEMLLNSDYEDEEDWDDEEDLDDDTEFDIQEDVDIRRMNTLYKGSDFDEYDDEALDDFSDCEDDECWENDLISDDYDDGM